MPVDEERKNAVAFGNAYPLLQSTYLVAPGSAIKTLADANAAGVRIAGAAGTATFRASNKASPKATHGRRRRRRGPPDEGRQDRLHRAFSRIVDRIAAGNSWRVHHRRWLSQFYDCDCRTERQAGGARLCQPVH